jgi:hypothetical protein
MCKSYIVNRVSFIDPGFAICDTRILSPIYKLKSGFLR